MPHAEADTHKGKHLYAYMDGKGGSSRCERTLLAKMEPVK